MSEVISSFNNLKARSQVAVLLMLFLCLSLHTMCLSKSLQLLCWYIVFVCHQIDVCEDSIGSVYVGGYCGLSERELCVFGKLCAVDFLVVSECLSILLQSVVISYVDCGDNGKVVI